MNLVKLKDTKLIHRNLLHFYTLILKYQKLLSRKIPIWSSTEKNKYIEINLNKEVKDLYSKHFKTLMKEMMMQINGKIYCVHGLEELTLLKCLYYQKQYTNLMQSLSKCPWHFERIRTNIPKICMEQETSNSQNNLER